MSTAIAFSLSTAAVSSSSSSSPTPTIPLPRFRKSLLPWIPSSFVSRYRYRYRYRYNGGSSRKLIYWNPVKQRAISPVMEWQDCTVKMQIDVPTSVAYTCYSDREAIPQWMPFISSVTILEDKPDLSRWSLKYKAFGQDIEFSWLARNMQPIPNQKIHWRSLDGLPNRGAVRFYPKGPSSCMVELTVSYEVPQLLVPVASALQPFLESLLVRGLEQFAKFAESYPTDSTV